MEVACVNSNTPPCAVALWNLQRLRQTQQLSSWASCLNLGTKKNNQGRHRRLSAAVRVVSPSCFCNPSNEPILEQALKEPVAFVGGMFAGLLRLDLNEDPLKEWITRTVEASGLAEENADVESSQLEEEVPVEIEIE